MGIHRKSNKAMFVHWPGYLFAVGTVVLATWLKYLAQPDIIPANIPILYILAIVLTATFFGLGPSIFCCFLSLAAFAFFFLPPLYTFSFNIEVVPISVVFLCVGVIISYLSSNLRKKTGEAKKEVAERKRAEGAVQTERQQFNDFLEMLPCYLILLTPDYHVSFANKFFRERFGESQGRRCYEYLFNRTEPCEVCETFKVLKKMSPIEWEWVGPDKRNYYIYDFPFRDVDGSTLIMEVGIDITVQKQALAGLRQAHDELELRVQERTTELKEVNRLLRAKMVEHRDAREREKQVAEEWRTTFDSITDMVSIQDKDCRLVRVNQAYADAVGMSREELTGQKCYAVVHGTDCPIENCPHQETLKTRQAIIKEIFEPNLGIYLEVTTSPIFNEAGELQGSVHIAKNITERKKAEEALQESQHDLNRAQAVAHTGSWRLDVRRNILSWSDETYLMFGIPVGTPMTYDTFLATIHPEDREYVDREWQAALRSGVYDIEHRIVVGNDIKWVREKAELDFDRNQELLGGFGTVQDITERKKADAALKLTLEQLHKSNRQTSALLDASRAVLRYEQFEEAARAIFDTCRDVIGATGGYIALLSEDGKENKVLFLESGGRPCTVDPNLPMPVRGLRAEAYLSGQAVFDNDFPDSRWAGLLPAGHVTIDNVLFAPLVIEGKTVGLIGLADKPGGFTRDDAEMATAFGGLASMALLNSRTLDSLQTERDKLTGILDAMEDGVYIVSRDGDIEYANPALKRAFGPVEGRKCYRYLHDREAVCPWCNNADVFAGKTVHWEMLLPKTGKTYDLVDTPIKNPDGSISKLEIFHDVTERKRVEHLKDEFIGLVSHELRTPLTVITGSLRTAMSEGLSAPDVRELIQNATEGADQLAVILENMLELSRHQAGRLTLRVEPVSIAGTARSVIKKLKEQRVSHQFSIDIPKDLPPAEADPMRVERILYNLLENAAKYSPGSSRITVSARTEGDFIVTAITDEGPGISPDGQAKLFEQFQQLETSRRPTSGVGLGLVVCKRLVEAQGGWIKVDSAPGKGSTFSFALPGSETPS